LAEPPDPTAAPAETGIASCYCANWVASTINAKKKVFFNNVIAWGIKNLMITESKNKFIFIAQMFGIFCLIKMSNFFSHVLFFCIVSKCLYQLLRLKMRYPFS
jgi:hypothetical protein